MKWLLRSPATLCIAFVILIMWCISAAYFNQSLVATQRSLLLPQLGGATGDLFSKREWWRLLTSQFLHVHFLHMILNVTCILLVGRLIEQRYGWLSLILIYFVGGTIGQTASVLSYPTLVTDGASQALMALSGAGVMLLFWPYSRSAVLLIISIQIALDFHAVGTIKAGHGYGFGAGLLIGLGIFIALHSKATRTDGEY